MRSAQSRVGVIDAAGEVRRALTGCVRALPVPAGVLKFGATAAAGTFGAGLLVRLLRPRRRASAPRASSGWGRHLLSELLVGLLLPLCRSYLLGNRGGAAPESRSPGLLSRLCKGALGRPRLPG